MHNFIKEENNDILIEVIKIIPGILWPILAITLIIVYKTDIKNILKRIKKWTILWNDFELTEQIDALQSNIKDSNKSIPTTPNKATNQASLFKIESINNPKLALIYLATDIERELNDILYSTWWSTMTNIWNLRDGLNFLKNNWSISISIASWIDIFLDIRNKIIHSKEPVQDDEILRVIDIWVSLLNALESIPREINVVYMKDVQLFADLELKDPVNFWNWIILETMSWWKILKSHRIFPTTQTNYVEGHKVSWEWWFENQWWETYYLNPITKKAELAWSSSVEFKGRDIEHLKKK